MWYPRALVPIALLLGLATLGSPVAAQGRPIRPTPMPPMPPMPPPVPYEVQVVAQGSPRTMHWLHGQRFIEGRIGERYEIRVYNRTWRRAEVVVSVDGRDAVDGRPASLRKRGYVIAPGSFVGIDGFRLNRDEVAAFRFSSVRDSYASRMGTPGRIGMIDVAVFPERVESRPSSPGAVPNRDGVEEYQAGRSRRQPGMGTEFGERRVSPVVETRFVRESWHSPAMQQTIRYDHAENLCAAGLTAFCPEPIHFWHPPQPRNFAEPPPGWEGGYRSW